eukprot:3618208-Pyramimonas_sp.AAC.1
MLRQPLLAPCSAVCGQVSLQLFVLYCFQGRPLLSRLFSSVRKALELAALALMSSMIETDQILSRRASFSSGASGASTVSQRVPPRWRCSRFPRAPGWGSVLRRFIFAD